MDLMKSNLTNKEPLSSRNKIDKEIVGTLKAKQDSLKEDGITLKQVEKQEESNLPIVVPQGEPATILEKKSTIPRIIHQSWKAADNIPELFAPWMQSWHRQNPTWKYVFWDDNDNLALFEKHFPKYYHIATSIGKIHLADMARYALLYLYGGVYVDCDFECKASFDDLLEEELFLSTEPFVHAVLLENANKPILCNAILASRPRHPFWIDVLDGIHSTFTSSGGNQDPVTLTGPRMVEAIHNKYNNPNARVTVFPEEYFYPEIAYWNIGRMKEICAERYLFDTSAKKACSWLDENPTGRHTSNTHAVHHWQCTWCRGDVGHNLTNLSSIFHSYKVIRPNFAIDADGI
ncbi:hypothetical protein THRCLA_22576 [Thraustotheca clavata]|uniref:Uncharacterized protein n=1 Tax=Thraustotheca clavata TaxID=74557 RepID=A0A1V9YWQ1_9STRA|nr:hypothetical protein THRCLA_22576 [Thraustotheca clavata]